MLLVKNPQFQTNQANILEKLHTYELIILTSFHNNIAKIVDFSSISYFGGWVKFFAQSLLFIMNNTNSPYALLLTIDFN